MQLIQSFFPPPIFTLNSVPTPVIKQEGRDNLETNAGKELKIHWRVVTLLCDTEKLKNVPNQFTKHDVCNTKNTSELTESQISVKLFSLSFQSTF